MMLVWCYLVLEFGENELLMSQNEPLLSWKYTSSHMQKLKKIYCHYCEHKRFTNPIINKIQTN